LSRDVVRSYELFQKEYIPYQILAFFDFVPELSLSSLILQIEAGFGGKIHTKFPRGLCGKTIWDNLRDFGDISQQLNQIIVPRDFLVYQMNNWKNPRDPTVLPKKIEIIPGKLNDRSLCM